MLSEFEIGRIQFSIGLSLLLLAITQIIAFLIHGEVNSKNLVQSIGLQMYIITVVIIVGVLYIVFYYSIIPTKV